MNNINHKTRTNMKKVFLISITSLFLIPTVGFARNWLKDSEQVTKEIVNVLDRSKTVTADNSSTTLSADIGQQAKGGTKVVTNHPDISIKLKRCSVSGKTCVIDLLITNNGSDDISMQMAGGDYHSSAFDDEGNQYNRDSFKVKMGNSYLTAGFLDSCPLPSGTPIKARIQIEGTAEEATSFTRIQLQLSSYELGLDKDKLVMLYNIPISREGDE